MIEAYDPVFQNETNLAHACKAALKWVRVGKLQTGYIPRDDFLHTTEAWNTPCVVCW